MTATVTVRCSATTTTGRRCYLDATLHGLCGVHLSVDRRRRLAEWKAANEGAEPCPSGSWKLFCDRHHNHEGGNDLV